MALLLKICLTIFLAIITATSCAQPLAESEAEPIPPATGTTPTPEEEKYNFLCIESELNASWSLDEATQDWNRNNNIFLITKPQCSGRPDIVISSDDRPLDGEFDGRTWFYYDYVVIKLSNNIPLKYRRNMTCHELGHALGRPHTDNERSCMQQPAYHDRPSREDLRAVNKLVEWSACTAEKLAREVWTC